MIDPELRLAIACCRYPRGPATQDAIAAALRSPIDWGVFDAMLMRHRIAGLAASALCSDDVDIPVDVRSHLAEAGRECAAKDLIQAAETARLQHLFDTADIPAMFLKGVVVGVLAFDALGIKESWDIDLLTTEDRRTTAFALLQRDGYRLIEPAGLAPAALTRFARFYHEAQFRGDRGITVELHWRLFSKPILTKMDGSWETRSVDIGGRPVRTLREDLMLAYLIAHGQEHGWSRLKWLADLNALLVKKSEAGLAALHESADESDAKSRTAAALLLCSRFFDLKLPEALAAALAGDRTARMLVEVSLDCIAHPLSGEGMPLLSRTSLALMTSRFTSGGGWRRFVGECGAIWTKASERARYPAQLDFLYHLLRVPIWLVRLPAKLSQLRRPAPSGKPERVLRQRARNEA